MKKLLVSLIAGVMSLTALAQNVDRVGISDVTVDKTDNGLLIVSMKVDPRHADVSYNRQLSLTPVISAASTSQAKSLPAVVVAGKNAYYNILRNDNLQGKALLRSGSKKTYDYSESIPFEDWMTNSVLGIKVVTKGCCGNDYVEDIVPVADLNYAAPQYVADYDYIEPDAVDSKLFNLTGKAYISFVVNKTAINPDYMNNQAELKKILGTIDAVKDNKDAKVRHIKLTGYASPEGPYENNVRLAEGRTIAVKEYVRGQYEFPENLFEASSVPEDWAGLKAAVEKSELLDAKEIVEFLDSDYPIEKRNDRLRALFPESYAFLLKNVYPGLRHTDYVITYEVRKYTDVNEIRQVFKTRPQNLSLNEFFLLSQTYKPGTTEFNDVFDTAVRMFPDDPTANINAASASISRGDLDSADRFLSRVGKTPQAEYVRGILDAKKGNYDSAVGHFRNSNNPKAKKAIDQINHIVNYKGAVTYR